jgi:hypothetical protein
LEERGLEGTIRKVLLKMALLFPLSVDDGGGASITQVHWIKIGIVSWAE